MNIACSEIYRRERASVIQKNAISLHISTVLIILSHLDSDADFFEDFYALRKRSFHHTKCQIYSTFKDLRKYQSRRSLLRRFRRLRRLHLKSLYVLTTVAFAMNYTHLRTSHRDHVFCRSTEEEEVSWSLRDEAERERRIMWRACIEFNIWQS